ncbi:hypothetical protein TWF225_006748 [Orbilia oligospora]|uniref:Uncharacterized protein n=2 Tax=Orbilia oligospora TaxID=2813651 RepID=A0A7C8NZC0_ORBOL|nr:hypothetical protein TWF102_006037 [Orbilia oligospora]KAF3098606.1 hypothetical protein TWF103_009041 [Orbilia oligospora]KAF3115134.1 hypothetical protein TWF706_007247 [Orbilia oligospora]KAF3121437.1 hypothetical protein TWF703_001928 [Orbilia oligospora]KAF3144241.1 hypothetical protein TWF594_004777 [Orbilia oligospora]
MKATCVIPVLSALCATALAATCEASSAIDVTPYLQDLGKNSGSGGGSVIDPDYIYRIIDNAVKRRVKRATLDCKSNETCVALQGVPLCFDAIAYTWRDTAGDNGNLMDGSYTLSDGRKGNLYTGPYPLPDGSTLTVSPPAATPTQNSNSNGSSSAKTETPNTTTPPNMGSSTTTGAPSASQTPNGGVKVGGSMGLAVAVIGGALAAAL